MHQGDKLSAWCFGLLEKKRNKLPFNPFEDGKKLMTKISSIASHFHYGERREKLLICCKEAGCAESVPHRDLNSTRMSAKHELLKDILRIEKGLMLYHRRYPGTPTLTSDEWQ